MAQLPNQTVIVWVLLGFLIAWMVTFAVLALRSNPQNAEWSDEQPTPAHTFPITHAPKTLHVMATQQAQLTLSRQDSGEISPFPVA